LEMRKVSENKLIFFHRQQCYWNKTKWTPIKLTKMDVVLCYSLRPKSSEPQAHLTH